MVKRGADHLPLGCPPPGVLATSSKCRTAGAVTSRSRARRAGAKGTPVLDPRPYGASAVR
eukprot:CAMPEP_0115834358 /NCGR_PEP_ID=MMETSP0287-20121206/3642_1 /TAXON_ID=412157 /ORGANISM="Chrysochromulina rotalis, Strain UIO044" /LENGTH=59 /DNA_ID=CAMNT_0003287791 /DNA_START=453 /DNA_END=628 /DNA_ORIENTATION=-